MRQWLQARIDAEDHRLKRLRDRIIQAMMAFKEAFKLETAEVDAAVEAGFEYRAMLDRLKGRRPAALRGPVQGAAEREHHPRGRQLPVPARARARDHPGPDRPHQRVDGPDRLQPGPLHPARGASAPDADIRDFQTELRACTEGALTGSDDAQYSETKFLQVRTIIERFRGREGALGAGSAAGRRGSPTCATGSCSQRASAGARTTPSTSTTPTPAASRADRRRSSPTRCWPRASPTSSGSGWSEVRSRSFRFVVIDEAFGRGSGRVHAVRPGAVREAQPAAPDRDSLAEDPRHRAFRGRRRVRPQRGRRSSKLRNLSIREYREEKEKARRAGDPVPRSSGLVDRNGFPTGNDRQSGGFLHQHLRRRPRQLPGHHRRRGPDGRAARCGSACAGGSGLRC